MFTISQWQSCVEQGKLRDCNNYQLFNNAWCLLTISHPSSANNYFIKFSASQYCFVSSLNLLYSNFSHGAYLPSHIHQARRTTSLNFRFPVLLCELVKFVVLKFFKCKRPEVNSTSDLQICTKCSNLESKKRSKPRGIIPLKLGNNVCGN